MRSSGIRLVAFDLDGTLVRGETCVEAIARSLGHLHHVREFEALSPRQLKEVASARERMAHWYAASTPAELCASLSSLELAPGAEAAFRLLRRHGVQTAIVSITWEFAVKWFARRLGADYFVGTRLLHDGRVEHFWPQDKGSWLTALMRQLGVRREEVAAVGDSVGDIELLRAAGHPFLVGSVRPAELDDVPHHPDGNLAEIALSLVGDRASAR